MNDLLKQADSLCLGIESRRPSCRWAGAVSPRGRWQASRRRRWRPWPWLYMMPSANCALAFLSKDMKIVKEPDWNLLALWDHLRKRYLGLDPDPKDRLATRFWHA